MSRFGKSDLEIRSEDVARAFGGGGAELSFLKWADAYYGTSPQAMQYRRDADQEVRAAYARRLAEEGQ